MIGVTWQSIRISRFSGPEVLELAQQRTILGPGEVKIKVLAAGTSFTDSFTRRGRYPDFKGLRPFTPSSELEGDRLGDGCVHRRGTERPASVGAGLLPTEAEQGAFGGR